MGADGRFRHTHTHTHTNTHRERERERETDRHTPTLSPPPPPLSYPFPINTPHTPTAQIGSPLQRDRLRIPVAYAMGAWLRVL
jgi:hypothetical protein